MVQISLPVAILSLAAFTSTAVASPLPGTPLPAAIVAKIKAANAASASASAAAAASVVKTSALVCGQNGYDKGVGSIQYGTFGDSSGSPYAKCLKRCKADKECVSFAYSGVDKACSLYSVTLAANFNENAASNWLFYDLGCSTTS